MEPRISLITLGVADLERAARFYEECLGLPRLETPPSVAFFALGKTWSRSGRAKAWPTTPASRREARAFGASPWPTMSAHRSRCTVVKPGQPTDWGGYAGCFSDPDGFLWEVAHNPAFPHV